LNLLSETKEFSLERIGAPWEAFDSTKALELRKQQPKIGPIVHKSDESRWEAQLHRMCS